MTANIINIAIWGILSDSKRRLGSDPYDGISDRAIRAVLSVQAPLRGKAYRHE